MRVLFTSSPGWGHVHPMVPVARALIDRGNEVLWATGADVCPRLETEGFITAPAGLAEREGMGLLMERFPEIRDVPPPEKSDFMFPRLFGTIRAAAMLADLLPVAEDWAPDLVVCDAAEFAGHVVAAKRKVPSVSHSFGGLLPEPRVANAAAAVAPLWVDEELEPRPYGGAYDHLYIDIYPPSLQPPQRPHVKATQYLSPSAFAIAGDEQLPDWVTAKAADPLVYVTFGTVFSNDEALSAIVEALRSMAVRVVVTVGPHGDPDSLGTQPDNVHVARYIPQADLLPYCSVVVSHAGSGTFLASLAASVPQLCVPQAADQFFNAAAGAKSGAALALPPDGVSVASVRGAVERLLVEDGFPHAAARISEEIATMPTAHDVAVRLEDEFG